MPAVTVPAKRYTRIPHVYVCAACGCLEETSRAHTTTCSTACRVRLHRHPDLVAPTLRICEALGVGLAKVLRADAVRRLRPDLAERLLAGTLTDADVGHDLFVAFMQAVFAAADAAINPEFPT